MKIRQAQRSLQGSNEPASPETIDYWYVRLQSLRASFSMTRLEIGALLYLVRTHKLWRGKARSFSALLEDVHLNASAVRLWMKVAYKFYFELGANTKQLSELSGANMRSLSMAADVATKQNLPELITKLTTLSERDFKHEVLQMPRTSAMSSAPRANVRVQRLVDDFYDLPDDLRIEVLHRLTRRSAHSDSHEMEPS